MGGLVTGTIVLLALEFLTEAFQYIPSPALGAVIIMAVINLFDLNAIKNVAKVNRESSGVKVFKINSSLAKFLRGNWILHGLKSSSLIKKSHTNDL